MDEPQNTDATPLAARRCAGGGAIAYHMTALGAISSAAYLQWLLQNPEQDILTGEDLTALQAVLAQRDYQIVTDIPEPQKPERVRRAGQRRLLADESTTPAPERVPENWPSLPRNTVVDAALEKAVRETFPPAKPVTLSQISTSAMNDEKSIRRGLNYLFVAGNYRYIDLYLNTQAGITARVYATASLLDKIIALYLLFINMTPVNGFLDSSQAESPQAAVTTLPPEMKDNTVLTSASASLIHLAGSWGLG